MSMHDRLPMRFPALGCHFEGGVYLIWGREGRVLHWLELDWGMGIACCGAWMGWRRRGEARYRIGYITTYDNCKVKCPTGTCHSALPHTRTPGCWPVCPVQEETTYLLSTTGKKLPIGNKAHPRQANVHWTYGMIREMSCHYNKLPAQQSCTTDLKYDLPVCGMGVHKLRGFLLSPSSCPPPGLAQVRGRQEVPEDRDFQKHMAKNPDLAGRPYNKLTTLL
ncbi:hypothetical protein HOY80DRAFT_665249 [Tuber brumale]|nr:hypothetical protein HOY80DRAFT_665249 [Tuber brumale]